MNEDQLQLFEEPKKTYTLNTGQQEAFDWLVPFCLGEDMPGDYRKALLQGYAGTGKTFLISRIVEEVRFRAKKMGFTINFGVTAPTHKAVKVLKKASDFADKVDFGTIHSFLALKEHIDLRTGKVSYKPDYENKFKPRKIDGVNILIIDESSMLHDQLFEYIEEEMRSNFGLRVIYMGDRKQIPPVRENNDPSKGEDAIPFKSERQQSHHIHVLSLTEPQRQAADSPIIMYSVAIREAENSQVIDYEFKEEEKEHIERMTPKHNMEKMREIFLNYFDTIQFNADPDHAKVIAWTNKTVDWANREIRLLINKAITLPKIVENEKLLMDEPLMGREKGEKEPKILIAKNMDVMAVGIVIENINLGYWLLPQNPTDRNKAILEHGEPKFRKTVSLKVYKCTLIDEEGKQYPVNIMHEESEETFQEIRNAIKAQALKCQDKYEQLEMWRQYYKIAENFAWVAYNYAITAHKSQGSTYQYVISMEWDIEQNRELSERNRIRYVAATRPKQKLWVIR
jgi:Intestiviridae Dda-like helicase